MSAPENEIAARLNELSDELNRPASRERRRALSHEYMTLLAEHPDAAELVYGWKLARIAELTGQSAGEWRSAISAAANTAAEALVDDEDGKP
jgi:hypothetical protein